MPDVRVICWNIKDYKSQVENKKKKKAAGTWEKHANTIMGVLYHAPSVRQFDIILIIETYCREGAFGFGDIVTATPGLEGVLRLFYALRDKDPAWRAVPLRASANIPKSDSLAVFYHSDVVDFSGPDFVNGIAIATAVPTPAHQAQPWNAATKRVGQVQFTDGGGTALDFDYVDSKGETVQGRSPYLTTFNVPDAPVTRQFTLQVDATTWAAGPPTIKTAALPRGVAGQPYVFALQAEGTGPFTWADAGASNLPAGVALAAGKIDGTPGAAGNYDINLTVTDTASGMTANRTLPFVIDPVDGTLAFVTAANLPRAVAGQPYELFLATTGGRGASRGVFHAPTDITHELPAGMTLAEDGKLAWALPTTATHTIEAKVVDQTSGRVAMTLQVRDGAVGGAPVIASAPPDGVAQQPYLFRLQAEGGTGPYTFVHAGGTLPGGLAFNGGRLEGIPGASGVFPINVTVNDNVGGTATHAVNLTVAGAAATLGLANGGLLPIAVAGQRYSVKLAATGGRGTGAFAHAKILPTDALPAGVTLAPDGTIDWLAPPGGGAVHNFDVELTDAGRALKILGAHPPPQVDYPANANTVRLLATIREISTARAGVSVAVCGDFNVCPRTSGGGAGGADCASVAVGKQHDNHERTSLDPLPLLGYATRNVAGGPPLSIRSSLQGSGNAQIHAYAGARAAGAVVIDDIACHAFDHVQTIGFNAVPVAGTINLIAEDAGYATALAAATTGKGKPAPLKAIVRKYVHSDGVSDHLPVRFTLRLT